MVGNIGVAVLNSRLRSCATSIRWCSNSATDFVSWCHTVLCTLLSVGTDVLVRVRPTHIIELVFEIYKFVYQNDSQSNSSISQSVSSRRNTRRLSQTNQMHAQILVCNVVYLRVIYLYSLLLDLSSSTVGVFIFVVRYITFYFKIKCRNFDSHMRLVRYGFSKSSSVYTLDGR